MARDGTINRCKNLHKPVEDKQQGKEKSAKCHPRKSRYEKGIPTFAEEEGGGHYRSINKELNRPQTTLKYLPFKDERNVIQKTNPNPAKDHRACGTHVRSFLRLIAHILCRNGRLCPRRS